MEKKLICIDNDNKVVDIVLSGDDYLKDKQNLIDAYAYKNILLIEENVFVEIGNLFNGDKFIDSYEQKAAKEEGLRKLQIEEKEIAKRQALLDKLGITEDEAKLLLGGN